MRLSSRFARHRGLVGATTILLIASVLPAAAATPAAGSSASPVGTAGVIGSPRPTAGRTAPAQVTLPTGDVVLVAPYGPSGPPYEVRPADRGGATVGFSIARLGADTYVVPSDVEAALGSGLDRESFNVTALARGTPSVHDQVSVGSGGGGAYDLVVQVLDSAGKPWAGGAIEVFNTVDFVAGYHPYVRLDGSGRATVRVMDGSYSVSARVPLPRGGTAVVADPSVEVTGDRAIVLDARDARPLSAEVVGVETALTQVEVAYGITDEQGRSNLYFLAATPADVEAGRIRVQPTSASSHGEFALTSHWRREKGPTGELYDLVFESVAIPDPPAYVQQPDDPRLARFDVTYQAPGEATVLPSARVWYTERTGTALIALHPLATPTHRVEFATASPAVSWYACVYPDRATETRVCEEPGPYEPGAADARWLDLLHPALDQVLRLDDTNLWIFAGLADREHTGALSFDSLVESTMRVRRNGEGIYTGEGDFAYVTVPRGRGRFAVDYDVTLTDDAVPTAHVSHSRWRFRSGSPHDPTGAEPSLLSFGYQPAVDELGFAAAGQRLPITVAVRNDGDGTGTPVLETARSRISTDGGENWHRRQLLPTADQGAYELVVPASYVAAGGSVSLKVRLVSAEHTAVAQRLIDAVDVAP